jgi:hypothetical protein
MYLYWIGRDGLVECGDLRSALIGAGGIVFANGLWWVMEGE